MGSNLAKWEAFDWDRHPKLRPAKRVIVDWYNGLPDSGALVLAGDVGCGKTHLADAIADLYGRWRIAYYGEVELVKKIQATYSGKGQSEDSVMRDLFRQDLLILDDLGTYSTSNASWLSNLYNQIFNDCLTVKNKPLLITTNIPMFVFDDDGNEISGGISDRIGTRSFSRLCDGLGDVELGRYIDLFDIPDFRVKRFLNA
jgi:DNA replication protein DnaC